MKEKCISKLAILCPRLGANWADLMAAQGAFGTDFYDGSIILRPKHRAYYGSSRPVIKIGSKGTRHPGQP